MDQFPKMLYSYPANGGQVAALQDGIYGVRTVETAEEHEAALADGWHESHGAARSAHETAVIEANRPPTREELETKARELEIKFDGRTSDKKLRDLIAATLEP